MSIRMTASKISRACRKIWHNVPDPDKVAGDLLIGNLLFADLQKSFFVYADAS